MAQSLSKLN